MVILTVNNLSFSFGTRLILDNVRFAVDEVDRCGIIGVNGAGKSTLFQLISNEYQPDDGTIQISKSTRIGYFKQDKTYESNETIGDSIKTVFKDVLLMEAELKKMETEISGLPLGPAQDALIHKYDNARAAFERADEAVADKVFCGQVVVIGRYVVLAVVGRIDQEAADEAQYIKSLIERNIMLELTE